MAGKRLNFGSRLFSNKVTWAVLAVAIALAVSWPAASLAATSSDFDLQAAINACPAGGTVAIPAGTYTFNSSVVLKSGVSLRGAGIDQTVLSMPAKTDYTNLLLGTNVSNLAISDMTITSSAAAGKVFAIHISTYSNITIERVKVTNCMYGFKADTQGSNLVVRDFTTRGTAQNYVSNLTGGTFENLDLDGAAGITGKWHCLYIAHRNHALLFKNVKAVGSPSFNVQLWTDYGWDEPSDDIEFDGFTTSGLPVAISSGFSNVLFKNIDVTSTDSGIFPFMVMDPHHVTIDGFTGKGGPAFFGRYTGYTTHDVSLTNGSYAGQAAVCDQGNWITNLTVQNVSLGTTGGGTTTTTAAPSTTTTTAAPATTTTTAAPATTTTTTAPGTTSTTLAPTTTTTAPPTVPASATVTLTNPADGANVNRGTVTIRASATSTSAKIGSVYFYVDGKLIGRDYRASYSYSWRTTSLAPGSSHAIKAVAYSSAGVVLGEASATVKVAQSTTNSTTTTTTATGGGGTYYYPYWWK